MPFRKAVLRSTVRRTGRLLLRYREDGASGLIDKARRSLLSVAEAKVFESTYLSWSGHSKETSAFGSGDFAEP